ncbi:MAG: YjjW family glycine radical enzyme activase [Spirochaetaceae bacterium]|jgi:pyruvate formate lyase activating enzyme|nr:YjjW family glycine radical enzyme activase [Spirochaetaceae bacterium]
MTALINRIIDHSGVNGPGIRMVLMFQGCNFHCRYCHVPETLGNCNGCGICAYHCPAEALKPDMPGIAPQWIEENCTDCGACINACRKDSSPKIRKMSIKDVLDYTAGRLGQIRGITCSGGECTLYPEFMAELFPIIRRQKLSCLIETNGSVDLEKQGDLMKYCDGVMLDIKAANPVKHQELTGHSNEQVFKNAEFLARTGKLVEIRTVITRTDYGAEETVEKAAALLRPYLKKNDIAYRLIPFRVFGVRREYRRLGTPSPEKLEGLRSLAESCGFTQVFVS